MLKKLLSIIIILTIFLYGCAQPGPEPVPTPLSEPSPEPAAPAPAEIPTIGEESVDEVGSGINDIQGTDDELDDSALDDLDSILGDIENI